MSLEIKLNVKQIVAESGMASARPEYFSGRGATISDLNSDILQNIYSLTKNEHGIEAANSFVQMVVDIPKLSATDFLLSMYRLEGNGWNWNKKLLGNEDGLYVNGLSDIAKMGVGFGSIASTLVDLKDRDDTFSIKNNFLYVRGVSGTKKYNPFSPDYE